jgi:hypothetical protein
MNFLLNLSFSIGIITLIFISPVIMNIGLVKLSNNDYKISNKEYLFCMIPVVNNFYGKSKYSGSKVSLSGISCIVLYSSVLFRYLSMVLMFNNTNLQVIGVYIFLLSILVYWILNALEIYNILNDSGVYGLTSKIIYSFTVILGHIMVGYYLPKKVAYYTNNSSTDKLYE